VWAELNTDGVNTVTGELAKQIVQETVKNLRQMSHTDACIDEKAYEMQAKKYKGWGGLKLTQD